MSAPITKQHLKLIDEIRVGDRSMRFDITDAQAAQLIADSEARAVAAVNASLDAAIIRAWGISAERDQLRTERNNLRADLDAIKAIRDEETARAERAEVELATERARLDWLLSRMGGNVLPVNGCVAWTVDVYHYKNQFPSRAAIDAAIKEETK